MKAENSVPTQNRSVASPLTVSVTVLPRVMSLSAAHKTLNIATASPITTK